MLKTKPSLLLYPPGTSKTQITKRAKYLSERINKLFVNLEEWVKDLPDYKIKKYAEAAEDKKNKIMFKLPAADILEKEKKIGTVKPVGLYAFGYNCRIDIISKKGNGIIVDASKESGEADWQVFPLQAGRDPKKLTKIIFRNLLKKLSN
ncbi:MAG: hypothetical protein ACM339_03705 [Ignavibacteria bacterium]